MIALKNISDVVIEQSPKIYRGLDPTNEYDISFLEKYINEDKQILGRAVKSISDLANNIGGEERIKYAKIIIQRIASCSLNKLLRMNVREEFNSEHRRLYSGFHVEHKYAWFIEQKMKDILDMYKDIAALMTEASEIYETLKEKNDESWPYFYSIWKTLKTTCTDLGMYSANEQELQETLTQPSKEIAVSNIAYGSGVSNSSLFQPRHTKISNNKLLNINESIATNEQANDIEISGISYGLLHPKFSVDGIESPQTKIISSCTVRYNREYVERALFEMHTQKKD